MKKRIILILISASIFQNIFSQQTPTYKNIDSVQKAEAFIINTQQDSALIYLPKNTDKQYVKILYEIAKNKNVSYKDYNTFLSTISKKKIIYYDLISDFIDNNVKIPTNRKTINKSFFNIKYEQITHIRNKGDIELSTEKNEALEAYVNLFDSDLKQTKISRAYLKVHSTVLAVIEKDIKRGKNMANDNIILAQTCGDKTLEITSLLLFSDFLTHERKLDEFIEITEKAYELEKQLPNKSFNYGRIMTRLLEGYTFKGGYDKKVLELLDELYNDLDYRMQSYSQYAYYLSTLEKDSKIKQDLFKKFGVKNAVEFSDLIINEARPKADDNRFYYTLYTAAKLLERDNYLKQALDYQRKAIALNKDIYGKDLSKSIASFKTKQAVKEKELEIAFAKERSKLYGIIAFLAVSLFIISLIILVKFRKQSKLLKIKNKHINKTLLEKELLVKEVHHRVKNNFQIVSSLLELQSKGIADKKALALASEGQLRVRSMAIVHKFLYENESGLIDFDKYIHILVKELSSIYASDKKVKIEVLSKNMMFDVDTAIPLGLIVNELITNAYKYAFKNNNFNKLAISIENLDDSNYKLIVSDNGKGMPPSFDIQKSKSLGLRLVNRLVKQLQGNLELVNDNGANFKIIFKDISARKRVK